MDRRDFVMSACAAPLFLKNIAWTAWTEPTVAKKIVVPFMQVDSPNKNKRVYPRTIAEKIVALSDSKTADIVGHIDHQYRSHVVFANLSHRLTRLHFRKIDGVEWLCGEVTTLDTPNGRLLDEMLEKDRKAVAFRCCGIGNVQCKEDGVMVIDNSYRLVSVDVVDAAKAA